MAAFQVKTRGNSSPHGKPRVFFSCHPQDFDTYFESIISGEKGILTYQNCAVYYNQESVSAEEVRSQLGDMQLFVVPITSRYLFEGTPNLHMELAFAVEQHIPILPIIVEEGLNSIFSDTMNQIGHEFGEMQFLDRTSTDPSEMSYEEKLQTRLSMVLHSDALSERIRAAFDAYIFLSYRKKDREAAKELMSLVHRIPFCQDIAIWYDEFLVPGERWNDAIVDAMTKSVMVLLATTPSLMEDGNFVAKEEYPAAVEMGKHILPAEIIPTNLEQLRQLFPGIPEVIDGKDPEALKDSLQSALKAYVCKEDHENLEHNYLVGLAYLYAIDMEKDTCRGLVLITRAAQQGLTEAMEKLRNMYAYGDTVETDYKTACTWGEKLIASQEALFYQNPGQETFETLIQGMHALCNLYYRQGKLDAAKSIYEKALQLAEINESRWDTKQTQAQIIQSLAVICTEQKKVLEAESLLIRSAEINTQLFANETLPAYQENLSNTYYTLAGLKYQNLQFQEAKHWYQKALDTDLDLLKKEEQSRYQQLLTRAYIGLGDCALSLEKFDQAIEWYAKASNLRKQLMEEEPGPESRHEYGISRMRLGEIYLKQGKGTEALEILKDACAIFQAIFDASATYSAEGTLGSCLKLLGDAKKMCGYDPHLSYSKALEHLEAILKKAATLGNRWTYCAILQEICINRLSGPNAYYALDDCKKFYERAKALWEEISDQQYLQLYCVSLTTLGRGLTASFSAEEALPYFKEALELEKTVVEKDRSCQNLHDLGVIYNYLGIACQKKGLWQESAEAFGHGIEINRETTARSENPNHCRELAILLMNQGDSMVKMEQKEKALQLYEEAISIAKDLYARTGLHSDMDSYIQALLKPVNVLINDDDYLEEADYLARELYVQHPIKEYRDTLTYIQKERRKRTDLLETKGWMDAERFCVFSIVEWHFFCKAKQYYFCRYYRDMLDVIRTKKSRLFVEEEIRALEQQEATEETKEMLKRAYADWELGLKYEQRIASVQDESREELTLPMQACQQGYEFECREEYEKAEGFYRQALDYYEEEIRLRGYKKDPSFFREYVAFLYHYGTMHGVDVKLMIKAYRYIYKEASRYYDSDEEFIYREGYQHIRNILKYTNEK